MPSIKTILNILALGSVMVDNPVPRHVLQKAIYAVVAVILSALLIGASLLAIVAYIYQLVVANGVPRLDAGLYIIATMLTLTALAIYAVVRFVKSVLDEFNVGVKKPVPLTTHLGMQAGNVIEAFIDGFKNSKPRY